MRVAVAGLLVACGSPQPTTTTTTTITDPISPPANAPPPLVVTFGDCVEGNHGFVSGPRPQPFAESPLSHGTTYLRPSVRGVVFEGLGGGTTPKSRVPGMGRPRIEDPLVMTMPAVVMKGPARDGHRMLPTDGVFTCYTRELAGRPSIAQGNIDVSITVDRSGVATALEVTGFDAAVTACVEKHFEARRTALVFGKARAASQLTYAFLIDKKQPASPPAEVDELEAYHPGATNPLRAIQAPLEHCFASSSKRHGVMVVEIASAAMSAMPTATSYGETRELRGCVDEAAKALPREPNARRCSLAFGPLAIALAPGIDIATDVVVDGRRAGTVAALVAGDVATSKAVQQLHETLETELGALRDQRDVIVSEGPLVLRASATTPMKIINILFLTADLADSELLLATRAGADWQLLRPVALPVVPVPARTGGSWTHARRGVRTRHDVPIVVSILVDRDALRIRGSRKLAAQDLPRGAADAQMLAAALRELAALPELAGRTDLELAAADDVPYRDLVMAVEAATAAGFTRWAATAPAMLTK